MTPASSSNLFKPSELESFFQHEEDPQASTTQKSSQVAEGIFSSPFQNIEDGNLSHSLDLSNYLLSPSDIQLEDVSYYTKGAFSLEDLLDESTGYKRLGSPREESPVRKRFRLTELEGSQDPISVSNEQQISTFLKPFEDEQPSIPQMDGFYQMVQTAEVLDPSRGEWMRESSQPPVDSDEEFIQFMQEELIQIEANSRLQESLDVNENETYEEIEGRLILSESSKQNETSHIEKQQTESDKETPLPEELIVLGALQEDHLAGPANKLCNKLKERGIDIPESVIRSILKKYSVQTFLQREAEFKSGWARFKASPISTASTAPSRSVRKPTVKLFIDSSVEQKVVELARKNPFMSRFEIQHELKNKGIDIPKQHIRAILKRHGLDTREKRKLAAESSGSIEKQAESSKQQEGQVKKSQMDDVTVFDETEIDYESRVVLNAVHENPEWGRQRLYNKLKERGITTISAKRVEHILNRYSLNTVTMRDKARQAGWPRFKTLPLPLDLSRPTG